MFNNIPNTVTRYTVFVEDSESAEVAIWDLTKGGIDDLPLSVYRAQTKLGWAIEAKDLTAGRAALKEIRKYIQKAGGRGDAFLRKDVFDPAQKFRNGTIIEGKVLLRFSIGAPAE